MVFWGSRGNTIIVLTLHENHRIVFTPLVTVLHVVNGVDSKLIEGHFMDNEYVSRIRAAIAIKVAQVACWRNS